MTTPICLTININTSASDAPGTALRAPSDIPPVGEYWLGQGGRLVGLHPAGGYLIAAEPLAGKFKFGQERNPLEGFSPSDGATNTSMLVTLGDTPAARAAQDYTGDGHADFYLPSQLEAALALGALGLSDGIFWTSTPVGDWGAWAVDFYYGDVYRSYRFSEFRVRPFRRFIPSPLQSFQRAEG